jgi:phage recombination protein Bet
MNTNTAVQKQNQEPQKPSALAVMASRLCVEPGKLLETLKQTVFQKASNEELLALVTVANEYGLNPFLKELYAFPAKGGGIVPIVSIDGWNKMLIRQPDFDGIEFEFAEDNDGNPVSCTAIIYIKNRSHPVKITEYLKECHRNTEPWNNMPRRMLRNRTLCQASRMAFGFSGIMNDDEAATVVNVESTTAPTEPPPKLIAAPERAAKPTPSAELEAFVVAADFDFATFCKWGVESQNVPDAGSLTQWSDVPVEICRRLMKNTKGLLDGLGRVKAGVAL